MLFLLSHAHRWVECGRSERHCLYAHTSSFLLPFQPKARGSSDTVYVFPPDESSLVTRRLTATGTEVPLCSFASGIAYAKTPSRGYWFTSPTDIRIVGLSLLGYAGYDPDTQSIQVITSESDFPFTTYTMELRSVSKSRWCNPTLANAYSLHWLSFRPNLWRDNPRQY